MSHHIYEVEIWSIENPYKYVPGAPIDIGYRISVYKDIHTLVDQTETLTKIGADLWSLRVITWDKIKSLFGRGK